MPLSEAPLSAACSHQLCLGWVARNQIRSQRQIKNPIPALQSLRAVLNFTFVSAERVSVLTDESQVPAPAVGGHGWEAAMGPSGDVGPEEPCL